MSEKSKKKQVKEKSITNTEMVESPVIEAEQTDSNASEKPAELTQKEEYTEDEKIARKARLEELKKSIQKNTGHFIQVVVDLREIFARSLWTEEVDKNGKQIYKTFTAFMDAEFGFKKAYYSRLNKAAHAYQWLAETDSEIQKQIRVASPALYETLDSMPEEDRIDTLKTMLEDKKLKQKGAVLKRIWEKKHNGQTLSAKPKKKEKNVKKQIEIALGILRQISLEKLEETDLSALLGKDNENLKKVIEYINGRIAKSK